MDSYEWFRQHIAVSMQLPRGALFLPMHNTVVLPPMECGHHWRGWTFHDAHNWYALDDVERFATDWRVGRCVYVAGMNLLALTDNVDLADGLGYDPVTCRVIGVSMPWPVGVYTLHPSKGWVWHGNDKEGENNVAKKG